MKLTPEEMRMLQHLRKGENLLRERRVLLLFYSAAGVAGWFAIAMKLAYLPEQATDLTDLPLISLEVAYFFPFALMYGCLTAWSLGYLIHNRDGDPKTTLLLKVVDELRKSGSDAERC